MQYLGLLYGGVIDKTSRQRIFAVSGPCTALIRRAWGGNFLLGEGEKVRTDHRHHAIDAMTIAMTTPDQVRMIAKFTPEERRKMRDSNIFIDNALFQQAKQNLDNAVVLHHIVNKIRGALHEETLYGKDYGENERHMRIALDALSEDKVADIVDEAIKNIILQKLGVENAKDVKKDMLKIFKDPQNLPVMTDKHGNVINIIKKVRVRKKRKTRTIGQGDG